MSEAEAPARTGVLPERWRELDRSGPRYTSYPTAVEFHAGIGESDYVRHLEQAERRGDDAGLSLYVHLPFCEKLCTFCACHFIATPHHEVARRYLDTLEREIELLAERLPRRRELLQLSWGGGTPTYLSPDELEELHAGIARRFRFAPDAEIAIEVDPRFTRRDHLETLARLGFNRLSMGVQDFTPAVQAAIGRHQSFDETRTLVESARSLGFGGGINFDLVYGLPRQTEASFERNLDRLLELRPDRVAVYSFAYVPWAKPHQRRIDEASLPSPETKLALALATRERLTDAGYEPVGLDHFALPGDELARAARDGRLDRNFMGYTARSATATVALGLSGIGDVEGAFFQNERRLADYQAAVGAGRLPIQRGFVLDDDDRLRQLVIRRLLCRFAVDKDEIRSTFGVEFDDYFAEPLARLTELGERSGSTPLFLSDERQLKVAEAGRPFVRNVCMAFDRYLESRQAAGRPVFSRTV